MNDRIEYQSSDSTQEERRFFSASVFFMGIACVLMAYGAVAGWLWQKTPETAEILRAKLASESVIIERPEGMATVMAGSTDPSATADPVLPAENPGIAEVPAPVETEPEILSTRGFLPDGLSLMPSGLAMSPVDGLLEVTTEGRVPAIRKNDQLSFFKAYRRPFNFNSAVNKPIIAIIVTDLGLSEKATELATTNLPADISFSFSPYANNLETFISKARAAGHETWITLPLEAENYPLIDPGPLAMLVGAPEQQNMQRLRYVMSRVTGGYVGLLSTPDPVFLQSDKDMRPVISEIYKSGLAFAEIPADVPAVAPQSMALSANAPYAATDILIDRAGGRGNIKKSLAELENIAKNRKVAIGVIRPTPASLQELSNWLHTLPEKGYVLAPLSALTGY